MSRQTSLVEDRLESSDDDDYHDERTGMLSASYDEIHRLALPPTLLSMQTTTPPHTPTPSHKSTTIASNSSSTTSATQRLRPVSMHAWITSSCKALHSSYCSISNNSNSNQSHNPEPHPCNKQNDQEQSATNSEVISYNNFNHTGTQTHLTPDPTGDYDYKDFRSSLRHLDRHQPDLVKDLQHSDAASDQTDILSQDRRLRFRSFFRWRSLKSRLMPSRNCHSLQPETLAKVHIKEQQTAKALYKKTPPPSPALSVKPSTQPVGHLRRPNPIIIVENYEHRNVKPVHTQILLHPQCNQATWGQIVNAVPNLPKSIEPAPQALCTTSTNTSSNTPSSGSRKWRLFKTNSSKKNTSSQEPSDDNKHVSLTGTSRKNSCSSDNATGFCGTSSSSTRSKTKSKTSTTNTTTTSATTNNSTSSNSCIAQ